MLSYLHVKNLSLIEEEEINFNNGLNVLTGETGAGKSIILGALSIALGKKTDKSILKDKEKDAVVEAVFLIDNEEQKRRLLDIDPEFNFSTDEDDSIILTRRITNGRTISKINGEAVTSQRMKEVGDVFLDVYGQKEHETLLKKANHLSLLDEYGGDIISPLKKDVEEKYEIYKKLLSEYESASLDEGERKREISFLTHEIDEIKNADLKENEDEKIEERYRFLQNGRKIFEAVSKAYGEISENGAADYISRALSSINRVSDLSKELTSLQGILKDAEALLSDFNREASSYLKEITFDEREFREIEDRLDTINSLKQKYGKTIEEINSSLLEKEEKLDTLLNFDEYINDLKKRLDESEKELKTASDRLKEKRKLIKEDLNREMIRELSSLNFLDVRFDMEFRDLPDYTKNGTDDAEFMIATNVGSSLLPLKDIASGGEISRIMLSLKTVIAGKEDVNTLIFDEIDSGISGRTAQAVSEKLYIVSKTHQVILISHLPQIACMADSHYLIEKSVKDDTTVSNIKLLSEEERENELSRMLGGTEITKTVKENAREMISLSRKRKEELR